MKKNYLGKFFLCAMCLALSSFLMTCDFGSDSDSDSDSNSSSSSTTANLDWFASSCDDLGGVLTPEGACFIACEKDADCPTDELRCTGADVWTVGQCEVKIDVRTGKGCGPESSKGWNTTSYGCYLSCPAEGSDDQCPANFKCIESSTTSGEFFCTGYAGGGSSDCNVDCPKGCCSTTGLTCCEPPFCSGKCAYSSCCTKRDWILEGPDCR